MIIVVKIKDSYYMQIIEKYFDDGGPFIATNYNNNKEYKQFLKAVKTYNEFSFKSSGKQNYRKTLANSIKENLKNYLNNINENWQTTNFNYSKIQKNTEHLLSKLTITIADIICGTSKNRTWLYYIDFIRQYIIL